MRRRVLSAGTLALHSITATGASERTADSRRVRETERDRSGGTERITLGDVDVACGRVSSFDGVATKGGVSERVCGGGGGLGE